MISNKDIQVSKKHTLGGHKDCIYTLSEGLDKTQWFSGAGDGMVVCWNMNDVERGRVIAKVPASIYALHYDKERNYLIVGQNYEGIHIVDLENNKEVGSLKLTNSAIFDIKCCGEKLIVATGDGKVSILDYKRLSLIEAIQYSEKSARCMAINPVAEEIAVGYSDNKIRILGLKDYTIKYEIEAHENSVFTLVYSPDYKWLLSGSRDAHLKAWGINEHYVQQESIVAHMYCINHIAYRPDGKYFATCSMDKSIKIWDAQRFKLLKVIDRARHAGHGTSVNRLLWSQHKDAQLKYPLISASDDRSISIWDINIADEENQS